VLLLLLLPGCGREYAQVSGQVRLRGKPLQSGFIRFVPKDPKVDAVSSELDAEGRYELMAPLGDMRIAVDQPRKLAPVEDNNEPETPPNAPPLMRRRPDQFKHIKPQGIPDPKSQSVPEKYKDFDSSGLTYTVIRGPQSHDVDLE
jgi:hypothetical protein